MEKREGGSEGKEGKEKTHWDCPNLWTLSPLTPTLQPLDMKYRKWVSSSKQEVNFLEQNLLKTQLTWVRYAQWVTNTQRSPRKIPSAQRCCYHLIKLCKWSKLNVTYEEAEVRKLFFKTSIFRTMKLNKTVLCVRHRGPWEYFINNLKIKTIIFLFINVCICQKHVWYKSKLLFRRQK